MEMFGHSPPKLATWFLFRFLRNDIAEEVQGDLDEKFYSTLEKKSLFNAKLNYWYQVFNYLRPFAVRNYKSTKSNHYAMFQNYFKVAYRNLLKSRLYSFINIFGLTIGMTCFILIALYIQYELSYDDHHEKADQIYRIAQVQKGNIFRGTDRFALVPAPLTSALKEEFPEIKAATTLRVNEMLLAHDEKVFYEHGLFSDEYVFDVFTFPLLDGIGKEALKDPKSIILTESLAKKYFPGESPIGKTMLFQNKRLLTVKGIIEDVPKSQHFTFDYITSVKNFSYYNADQWNRNSYYAYAVLPAGYDYKELEEKLVILDRKYLNRNNNEPLIKSKFFLQPLKDIHLHSHINFEINANGDIRYIYLFASIAFIIILLASINYMNLATARSALRVKEAGLRKAIGANRVQLVYQMLGESFLVTLLSFSIAIVLVIMLLPAFNQLLNQPITISFSSNRWLLIGILLTALLIGGFSGLYPAMFLSAVSPVKALKGGFVKNYKGSANLQNTLVVGQFTAAIVLMICSVVIYQQLNYIQNKKLGYNREQVIYVPYRDREIYENATTIRTKLLSHSQIDKISFARYMPLNMISSSTINDWEGNNNQETYYFYSNHVDYDFIDLFEMELVEGRDFSPDYYTDSISSYIFNESAVKILGWESAVGKEFNGGQVVGVVRDFHFQPFDLAIEPLYLVIGLDANKNTGNIAIKVKMSELDNTLAYIQQTLKSIVPQAPFEYRFMDEAYNQLYQSERQFGQAFNIFTLLALVIACIGLFGLVAHNVLHRTKEIGIRKVLGATVSNIVGMFSKDFLMLVIIATVIAFPIAWWGMSKWLEDFVYRIDINWSIFVLAGVLAVGISFLTVSFQSIKAAKANPVESLRSE